MDSSCEWANAALCVAWIAFLALFWVARLHPTMKRLVKYGIRTQKNAKGQSGGDWFEQLIAQIEIFMAIRPSIYWCSLYAGALSMLVVVSVLRLFAAPYSAVRDIMTATLYGMHLSRRLYESALLFRFSNRSKVPGLQALAGFGYYVLAVLTIVPMACEKSLVGQTGTLWSSGWLWVMGAKLFVAGNVGQHYSHRILASLRSANDCGTASQYAIPRGHLFEWVTCPHYMYEIVLYCGITLMNASFRFSAVPSLLMTAFVASNLSGSALDTHQWYTEKFGRQFQTLGRTALVPWLL